MNNYEMLIADLNELVMKLESYRDKVATIIDDEKKSQKYYINTKELIDEDIRKKREIACLVNDEEYSRYTKALKVLIGLVSLVFALVIGAILYDKFLLFKLNDLLLMAISIGSGAIFGRISYLVSTRKYRKLRKQYDYESLEEEIMNLLNVSREKEQKITLIDKIIDDYKLEKENTMDELDKLQIYKIELINNTSLLRDITSGSVLEMNEAFLKDNRAQMLLRLVRTKNEQKDKGDNI